MVEHYKPKEVDKRPPVETRFDRGQSGKPPGRRRQPSTLIELLAKELHSTVFVFKNRQKRKTSKLELLVSQLVDQAANGNCEPLVRVIRVLDTLERLNKIPAKISQYNGIDIKKMSLEEKQKFLNEVLANTRPLNEY